MDKRWRSLLFILLYGCISVVRAAGEALPGQLQQIESLQRHADKLALGEPGTDNYYLSKARSWLDLALGEYYENEGNAIVPSAIAQAQTLLDALEKNKPRSAWIRPCRCRAASRCVRICGTGSPR